MSEETAFQVFGRMLKTGELKEVTSFHLLGSDLENFAYNVTGMLSNAGMDVDYTKAVKAIREGKLILSGVTIRLAIEVVNTRNGRVHGDKIRSDYEDIMAEMRRHHHKWTDPRR